MFSSWIPSKQIEILQRLWDLPAPELDSAELERIWHLPNPGDNPANSSPVGPSDADQPSEPTRLPKKPGFWRTWNRPPHPG